jgi:hypothetical protein
VITIELTSDLDLVHARTTSCDLARQAGFSAIMVAQVATAVCELARDVLLVVAHHRTRPPG